MFDAVDYEIIMCLQKNPFATVVSIAKDINKSLATTHSRVNSILNEKKAFRRVQAELNNSNLGLEIHSFLYEVNGHKNLRKLEREFCYLHPYVFYQGRFYGKYSGVYIQYRIPKGGFKYLEQISAELKSRKIIDNYDNIKMKSDERSSVIVKSALQCWDRTSNEWIFDWDSWKKEFFAYIASFEDINDFDENENKKKSKKDNNSPKNKVKTYNEDISLKNLKEIDIKLLAQITLDARQKNIDIIRKIGLEENAANKQLVSRHLKMIKKEFISDYRIFLRGDYFDLNQTILIRGHCNNYISEKLKEYLKKGYTSSNKDITGFPFQSVFNLAENGYLWYIRAPPNHMSELLDFVWSICSYDIFMIDYKNTKGYGLWDQTFDLERKEWKKDENFMVTEVINRLDKYKGNNN